MRVITVEDHNAPVIAVNVTYNVGSRNEKPGRTGFARTKGAVIKGKAPVNKQVLQVKLPPHSKLVARL